MNANKIKVVSRKKVNRYDKAMLEKEMSRIRKEGGEHSKYYKDMEVQEASLGK